MNAPLSPQLPTQLSCRQLRPTASRLIVLTANSCSRPYYELRFFATRLVGQQGLQRYLKKCRRFTGQFATAGEEQLRRKGAEADGCYAKKGCTLREQLCSEQPGAARPHGTPSVYQAMRRPAGGAGAPPPQRPQAGVGAAGWAAATEAAGLFVGSCAGSEVPHRKLCGVQLHAHGPAAAALSSRKGRLICSSGCP